MPQDLGRSEMLAQVAHHGDHLDFAFKAALCEAQDMLLGRATMMLGSRNLAEDLAQDTFERALRARHRPVPKEVQPWLLRILRNLAIDRWRASLIEKRSCELHENLGDLNSERLPDPWWYGITRQEVDAAVERLPSRFRTVLSMRMQGLTYDKIGRQLGLNRRTVGTRLYRARRLLRAIFFEPGNGAVRSGPLPSDCLLSESA